MSPENLGPLIGIGVALVLIVLRNRRPRTLRPQWLWVAPVMVTALIGFGLWGLSRSGQHAAFGPGAWTLLIAGLALGALAGWWRAKSVTIFQGADGVLKAQASPLGILLILGLFIVRGALKTWLGDHAEAWHLNALALTDAFMLFAVGLVVAQRAEMYIRARRILAGRPDEHVEPATT